MERFNDMRLFFLGIINFIYFFFKLAADFFDSLII